MSVSHSGPIQRCNQELLLQDLAHTLRTRLVEHTRFVAPKRPQHAFGVEHYAGRVTYSAEYLLEKNKVCKRFTSPCLQGTEVSKKQSATTELRKQYSMVFWLQRSHGLR